MFLHPTERIATDTMYNAVFFHLELHKFMPESANFPCVAQFPVLLAFLVNLEGNVQFSQFSHKGNYPRATCVEFTVKMIFQWPE
jgi:hypothetical protein